MPCPMQSLARKLNAQIASLRAEYLIKDPSHPFDGTTTMNSDYKVS